MKQRIFLAINLPPEIKKILTDYQNDKGRLFNSVSAGEVMRWTPKENLHITLVFIGPVVDQVLPQILQNTERIVSRHKSFPVQLQETVYGPPKKMPPRMIWATAKRTDNLLKLQAELSKCLLSSSHQGRKTKERPYSPHITLGRIRTWQFKKINPEDRPQVREDISSTFQVNSIEVMESKLKRTGAEYTILQSFPLS